jgi:hypothetical protein
MTRTEAGVQLADAIVVDNYVPPILRPLIEAWAEWTHRDEQDAAERSRPREAAVGDRRGAREPRGSGRCGRPSGVRARCPPLGSLHRGTLTSSRA